MSELFAPSIDELVKETERVKVDDATMTEEIRAQTEAATLQSWPVDIEPIRR